jgi:signal transduction histidine kinase
MSDGDPRDPRSRPRDLEREASLIAPGLVHEMRQPLMGVDAGLRLIARDLGETVTGLEAWGLVTAQVSRLDETLRSYGDLMSPSRGAGRAFPVEPVVRQAADLLRYRLRRLGDRYSLTVEDGVPDAFGAPAALLHAVTNLVVNALDALESAGGTGRLEIRVLRGSGPAGRPQVRVVDEGTGVPDGVRALLFESRFTTKPPSRGSGLGLLVARRMIRSHGGEVRLAAAGEPERRPWSRTELVIDLAAGPGDAAPREPSPLRRRTGAGRALAAAAFAAAVAVTVAGGWTAFRGWVRGSDPTLGAPAAQPPAVTVASLEGRIERRSGQGPWSAVEAGERLHPDDTIRTGEGSSASVVIGGSSRIAVADRTQLTVREITSAVQRLRLARGRIAVDHQPDGERVLVVEGERGDAVARTLAARFSVLATGTALGVATESGVVRLRSGGADVPVVAGERSVAIQGLAPSPAAPVARDVLLRVAAAAAAPDARSCAVVEGKADPGAEVSVDGIPVALEPDGSFHVRAPRSGDRPYARVVTREVDGRTVERRVACAVRAGPEVTDFAVKWHDGASPPQKD